VYALDIQESKLSALKSRLEVEKIGNVATILCDLEKPKGSTLRDGTVDIVLIPNVLFQSENKGVIITEAKRVLRIGGQLLIIDWAKEAPFSPKNGTATSEQIKSMAQDIGLSCKKEWAAGDYHYALLFIK
jgi:ubiquinone/menaquinone biosynthesis C-methylase UbiE